MKTKKEYDICPDCEWHWKELCNNPDHWFIDAISSTRYGEKCPVCGRDEYHRTKYDCSTCKWSWKIIKN